MIDTSYGRMLSLLTARRLLPHAQQDAQGKTKLVDRKEASPTAARVEVSVVQRTTQVTVAQHIDHWA